MTLGAQQIAEQFDFGSLEQRRPAANFLDAGGIRTHYIEEGSGAPTLLLHGAGAGADGWSNWCSIWDSYAEQVHAIAMDFVGFGQSDCPDPTEFTYSQNRRDQQVVDFIEALGLGSVNIVGNSMGGITAIGVARARPDLVNKIVLMGSAGVNIGIVPALKSLSEYDFTPAGMRRIFSTLAHRDYQPPEELVSYRYQKSLEPHLRSAYSATMQWIKGNGGLNRPDDFIAGVSTPTLVVHGKDDVVCPLESGLKLLDLIDSSTGLILPNCGHWAMLEHSQLFSAMTLAFLSRD